MKPQKYAPLYTSHSQKRGAIVRVRTLQQMNIIHLRKVIADETAEMLRNNTVNFEQMERVRKLLKNYGQLALSTPFPCRN
jgi:hypothetical protein